MEEKNKKEKDIEEEEAKKELLQLLEEAGWIIYTNTEYISSDGMTRVVDVFVITNNVPFHINNYLVQLGSGLKKSKKYKGVVVSGCGSDVGAEIEDFLNRKLFNCGKKIKQKWL